MSRHFSSNNHTVNDVNVTVITTTSQTTNIRFRTEEVWIALLQTRARTWRIGPNSVIMENIGIECEICHRRLKNSHNLARHMKNIHGPTATQYQCSISRRDVLNRHTKTIHGIPETKSQKTQIKQKLKKTMTIAPRYLDTTT